MIKRYAGLWLLILALLVPMSAGAATSTGKYVPLPSLLIFTQHTETRELGNKLDDRRTYPDTANERVNEAVAAMVDRLADEADGHLPARGRDSTVWADTGASVTVTGTKTASFLVLSHILQDKEQTWVGFETAVYDLKNGRKKTLSDFFTEEAGEIIRREIVTQLNAYFPEKEADQALLLEMAEQYRSAPFTLSPAYLILHYRADALYGEKQSLMHVRVPYQALKPYMTVLALSETDNARYLVAAPTFDDGPGRGVTNGILLLLREKCAGATFFNLGQLLRPSKDYILWEHDAGYSVQSHTFSHTVGIKDADLMYKERDKFARYQIELIGIPPAYMRAPGGVDGLYCKYDIGMPVIRWNTLTSDASKEVDINSWLGTFGYTLKDTSVILMHNIRWSSVEMATQVLTRLQSKGYLTCTVDELFLIRGIELEKNVVYFGDEADQEEAQP